MKNTAEACSAAGGMFRQAKKRLSPSHNTPCLYLEIIKLAKEIH